MKFSTAQSSRNLRLLYSLVQAVAKEQVGQDTLAIAWQRPGHVLEVIPARFSMMTRPTPNTNVSTSADIVEQPVDANETNAVSDVAVVQSQTIYDVGKAGEGFSILMAFVDAAGLADLVSGPGPITVLGVYELVVGHFDGFVSYSVSPNLIGSLNLDQSQMQPHPMLNGNHTPTLFRRG